MKKLFLHIGANKAGTTSLQFFLNSNYSKLLDEGFLYPRTGCLGSSHTELSAALGFDSEGLTINYSEDHLTKLQNKLQEEVILKNPHSIIVSSESFVLPGNLNKVKNFFNSYDVKVIIYLRRHDHWIQSLYNQAVKSQFNPKWPQGIEGYLEFLESPQISKQVAYIDYKWLVSRWAEAFGKCNVFCIPFEPGFRKKNIFEDFQDIVNFPLSIKTNSSVKLNESLSAKHLFAIDYINRTNLSPIIKKKLGSCILNQSTFKDKDNDKFSLTYSLRIKLLNQHRECYKWIANNYGTFERPDFFNEPWPEIKDTIETNFKYSTDDILFDIFECINDLWQIKD